MVLRPNLALRVRFPSLAFCLIPHLLPYPVETDREPVSQLIL